MFERVLKEEPNFLLALWMSGGSYSSLGMHDEAVARLQTLVQLTDRLPIYVGMLGQARARASRRGDAEALLQELNQRSEGEYVPPATQSWIAIALGDADRALEWLEQEYRDRGIFLFSANVGPWFDEFRSDSRFQDLLRKMNFPTSD